MKLLFDQNLSPTLVQRLADLFPGSIHTEQAGLARSDDVSIWEFCLRETEIRSFEKNPEAALLILLQPH
jgi:predicted nuclease of predicted toxin-antitoxin system